MEKPAIRIVVPREVTAEKTLELAKLLAGTRGVQVTETEQATTLDVVTEQAGPLLEHVRSAGLAAFPLPAALTEMPATETATAATLVGAMLESGVPVLSFETRSAIFAPFLLKWSHT
jgi:hypothetical protein